MSGEWLGTSGKVLLFYRFYMIKDWRMLRLMETLRTYWQAMVQMALRDRLLHFLAAFTFGITVVNIMTYISDARRQGGEPDLLRPVITEFSSALALVSLLPALFVFFDRLPLTRKDWVRLLLPYFAVSVAFSLLHVTMMVLMRKLAWVVLFDGTYDFFSNGPGDILYEYRKDLLSFLLYVSVHKLQRQVKMAGKAGREKAPVVLKSGATTIHLYPDDFLYAKAAGNYVDITSGSGTQLARITLSDLENLLQDSGADVVRIHRSAIVNRSSIVETAPIAGGDMNVKLKGGEMLRASRRYKERLL